MTSSSLARTRPWLAALVAVAAVCALAATPALARTGTSGNPDTLAYYPLAPRVVHGPMNPDDPNDPWWFGGS